MSKRFLGLRTTCYKVADLESGKKWYSEVFETEPYFDEPYYVGFNIAGYELGLQEGTTANADAENVVLYWGVDDVEGEYNRLLTHGATMHEEPTNVGGDIVVASVRDPWGNVIGIIYNPEFKIE